MSSAGERPDPAPRPTLLGRVLALAVGLAILVALSEVVLRVAMPDWRAFSSARFMRIGQVPGYGRLSLGVPGFDGWFAQNNGDFRVRIRINRDGLRNPEPAEAAGGRIWVIGDSMTFGWGVAREKRYSDLLARRLGRPTYNVASPGTNLCGYQALLARMPPDAKPVAAIVGLVLENDVEVYACPHGKGAAAAPAPAPGAPITLLDVKEFLTARSALYNFLAVALKRVGVVNAFLIRLGLVERPHQFQTNIPSGQAAKAEASTADEIAFLRSMLPPGIPFAVLVMPARFEIRDGDPFYAAVRRNIEAALAARGIPWIDPFAAFKAAGLGPTHFAHDGHWSERGHAIAARAVAAWLGKALGRAAP